MQMETMMRKSWFDSILPLVLFGLLCCLLLVNDASWSRGTNSRKLLPFQPTPCMHPLNLLQVLNAQPSLNPKPSPIAFPTPNPITLLK